VINGRTVLSGRLGFAKNSLDFTTSEPAIGIVIRETASEFERLLGQAALDQQH